MERPRTNRLAMAHSADPEQEIHDHGGNAEGPPAASSSSSATCNPIRSVAAALGSLGSLMPCCFRPGPPPLPPRVYHVWPGKNVFFCGGRVICGPDPRGLIVTVMTLLVSEWIFLTSAVDWTSTHATLISACSTILLVTVTVTLLLTAMRDPGIVPRNHVSPLDFTMVDGVETRLTFCRVCKIFRSPRSSHCAHCDNCVEKFDHHCVMISQCIGLRNYRLYLVFVCSALAFYAFIFPFTVRRIRAAELDSVWDLVGLLGLAALSLLAIGFFAMFLGFNAFLVAKNKTSHERHEGRHSSSPNPYDKGTLGNIKACLFEKLPPPRVDFKAVAEPDDLGSTTPPVHEVEPVD